MAIANPRIYVLPLLICIGGFTAFGQEAGYPANINSGDILLNGGVGFGEALDSGMKVPPLVVSMDFAIPFAAMPFTAGLAIAYSSEEGNSNGVSKSSDNLGIAARLGFHHGWNVDALDTYLHLSLGDIMAWESAVDSGGSPNKTEELRHVFWVGFGAGARYFFFPKFGAYAELMLGNLYNFSIGVSVKW